MPSVKPRILLLENSLYTTGGLKAILSSTESLKDEFEFIYIIDSRSSNKAYLESLGYRTYSLPFLELSKSAKALLYLPRLWSNTRKLLRIARAEEAAIVHVNDIFNLIGCAAKLLRPRLKLVYHVRLLKASYIRALYPLFARLVRRYAERIVAVSNAVRADLSNDPAVEVVYDAPEHPEKHAPWNGLQEPRKARIFYLGNYMPGKGQNFGLEAFLLLRNEFPEAVLHFAGGVHGEAAAAFRQSLVARAEAAGAGGRVVFGESVTDIEQAMKTQDVVLNLSESESFSFVCLEAMQYGVPLVAADSGGPAEITDGGRQAALVPNRDPAAAAEALSRLLRQPADTIRKAGEAKDWARRFFDPARAKEQLAQIYRSLGAQ